MAKKPELFKKETHDNFWIMTLLLWLVVLLLFYIMVSALTGKLGILGGGP